MTSLSFSIRTSAVKSKGRNLLKLLKTYSQFIIQKMMTSSLEIQFKHKVAINLHIICILLGIISSLCCGCSGKHPFSCFNFPGCCFRNGWFYGGHGICLHKSTHFCLRFSSQIRFVGFFRNSKDDNSQKSSTTLILVVNSIRSSDH